MTAEKTDNPFIAFYSALEAQRKIDEVCGTDWNGDEEIFQENEEIGNLYKEYLEKMREFRRGFRPDLVIGGAGEDLKNIIRDMSEIIDGGLEDGAIDFIKFSKEFAEIRGHEHVVDVLDTLISLKYFDPDGWISRYTKKEIAPLLVRSAGIPDWLKKRYTEAVYAYIYGFYNASVALCRTIVEGILRSRLEEKNINTRGKTIEEMLVAVNKLNLVKNNITWWGDFVRQIGNLVLHDVSNTKSLTPKKALHVISTTKYFIANIY